MTKGNRLPDAPTCKTTGLDIAEPWTGGVTRNLLIFPRTAPKQFFGETSQTEAKDRGTERYVVLWGQAIRDINRELMGGICGRCAKIVQRGLISIRGISAAETCHSVAIVINEKK